jgi:hypothetical protein
LKGLDPLQQALRVMCAGMIEDVLGRVRREDHPIGMFGQHRPETPHPAGHVEDQPRFTGDLECIAHQTRLTPEQ